MAMHYAAYFDACGEPRGYRQGKTSEGSHPKQWLAQAVAGAVRAVSAVTAIRAWRT
jgi:hypothetical protein